MSIQAITFDAAGTLIVPYPSVGEVYAEVLAGLGFSIDANVLEQRFRHAFKSLKQENPAAILDRQRWRLIVERTLTELIPSGEWDAAFDALWEAFAQPNRWKAQPGVEDSLAKLHTQRIKLFVLSNNDERLHQILNSMGLGRFFEAIFVSAELGAEKPSPEIFQAVEARIGLSGKSILHIGDSPVEDIDGALRAGWRAALVGGKSSACADCLTTPDLPALLERLTPVAKFTL